MKLRFLVFVISIFVISGCGDSWIKKPEGLIPEKQIIDMLFDMHLSSAFFDQKENRLELGKVKIDSEDFYYSVLKKYNVPDSTFEKSIIYYSNFPKEFEKIYAIVLDRASQVKESYSEEDKKPVDLGNGGPR